jgi:hypothetical protein
VRSQPAAITIGEVAKASGGDPMNCRQSRNFPKWLLVLILLASAGGCAGSVPTYPRMRDEDAARIISDRLASVRTISARCEVTLTNSQGDSVHLDGALAAASPDRLRLRAWKFDRAVFDLTLTPEGLWLFMGDDASGTAGQQPIVISAAQISQAWTMLNGGFFAGKPSSTPVAEDRPAVIAFRSNTDGTTVHCRVDRRTLTPTLYSISDSSGVDFYSVNLSAYQMINGIAWPMRIDFHGGEGELSLRLDDLEFNSEIAEGAFVPPVRAVKQP